MITCPECDEPDLFLTNKLKLICKNPECSQIFVMPNTCEIPYIALLVNHFGLDNVNARVQELLIDSMYGAIIMLSNRCIDKSSILKKAEIVKN